MKKIDWYILKNYLVTFTFMIMLFTVISVVIDISERAEDFVKADIGAWRIFKEYYTGFIPHIVALLFPLFVFIAVIFFTSRMAGRSEIIAILASGTSYNSFLRPYWIGGALLASILWLANQYVVPVANEIRTSFKAHYIDKNSAYEITMGRLKGNDVYFKIDSFTYAGVHNYDTNSKSGSPFFLYHITNNEVQYNLRADVIRWDTAKKKWILDNVVRRKINGLKEDGSYKLQDTVAMNFKPFDVSRDEYAKDKLIRPALKKFIDDQERRGAEGIKDLQMEDARRDATPFSVIILTLMGVCISSKKVRGGSGAHLAIGIVAAAMFLLSDRFSTIFATKGNFPPLLAAWTPNLIFIFVAYYFYRKAPK